jgi:N-acetylglucosamine kinase-like BadF-type ATPase
VTGVIVAVDGGGSKTDAVALTRDGEVLSRATGPGSSPHFLGVEASAQQIDELVRSVVSGLPVDQANLYLSGIDLPVEVVTFRERLAPFEWSSASTIVDNDLYALLRAGTSALDAVAVVCGSGINAMGRRADGETARFAALGAISGDWGGGSGIGESALWHAARDADRRGAATTITAALPAIFGLTTVDEVTQALHLGRLEYSDLGLLSPLVFEHARAGDVVAGGLVDRQGAEIALMAASCIDRLGLGARAVPVVLGGGVVAAGDPRLLAAVQSTLDERAPLASITHMSAPPIVGAALLALESVGASSGALERARRELS